MLELQLLNEDQSVSTVASLVSTSFNSIAKIDYTDQYGVFDVDVDFVDGKFFYFELITAAYSDFISIYIDSNSVEVTTKNSSTVMDAVNYPMSADGNYKLSVKRNSSVNEYVTGGIGETQITINDVVIFDDVTSETSFNYSLSDDLSFIQWQAGEGVGIRSINEFLPEDFTITSNTFEIQQIETESVKTYNTLDIFEDEGVDLTIPLFPSSDLSERLIDYTDTFDIPATEHNLALLDKLETERFKGRMKNGDNIINGFFSVSNIEEYTPDATISLNFISIVKYVVDKMKETPFSYLFKPYTETGANLFQAGERMVGTKLEGTDTGNYLNYPSTQAYGTWTFEFDYISGGVIEINPLELLGGGQYYFRIDSGAILFRFNTTQLFSIPNNLVTTSRIVKVTIKRNETLDQYFTGDADAFAFYIDDILIDDSTATVGTNPLTDSNLTTSDIIHWYCTEEISLYNYPSSYTIDYGGFSTVNAYEISYINDGNYGFILDESNMPHIDSFMSLAVNNQVSDQYSETDYPVYLLDSQEGSRSAQPTYNVEKLIEAIFDYYDVDVDTTDFITGTFGYDDCYVKIPTNFLSEGKDGDEDRNHYVALDGDGVVLFIEAPEAISITGSTQDAELFPYKRLITTEDEIGIETTRAYLTPQHTCSYDVSGYGKRSDYYAELKVRYKYDDDIQDPNNPEQEAIVQIPDTLVTWKGTVKPSVGIYYYDDLVYHFETPEDCLYNNLVADLSDLAGNMSVTYGDAITMELGVFVNRLVLTLPDEYSHDTGAFSGSQTYDMTDGFHRGEFWTIDDFNVIAGDPAVEITENGTTRMYFEFGGNAGNQINLIKSDDYVEARYGDKVLLEKSYENKELKMYDVIDTIVKRFNLSIKDQLDGSVKFIKEPDFYTDDVIILDNRVSKRIGKMYNRNDVKSISITNEEYGNINDRIDTLDDSDEMLIYDIDSWVLDESKFEEIELSFNSTLQNNLVYGERLTSDDIAGWSFLKLENNSALWNTNVNEKIETDKLPISFGTLERSLMDSFRIPRSVYADENNYPDNTSEEDFNIMVVEHTLFDASSEFKQLNYEDDFNLSNKEGGLDKTSVIYENFEDYFWRNGNIAVNVECNAYLTNEEILNIRNGYKVYLFGDTYKPISISDIEFEKDGSICTIEMTREPRADELPLTFDSTLNTWDIDTITFDNY